MWHSVHAGVLGCDRRVCGARRILTAGSADGAHPSGWRALRDDSDTPANATYWQTFRRRSYEPEAPAVYTQNYYAWSFNFAHEQAALWFLFAVLLGYALDRMRALAIDHLPFPHYLMEMRFKPRPKGSRLSGEDIGDFFSTLNFIPLLIFAVTART